MKVRCIDGSWTDNELTTGKEYEVLSEMGCYYQLKANDKGIEYHCYVKSRFEIVEEDKEMLEKTFQEVIATIKEREIWVCEKINRKIIKADDGIIEIRGLNDEIFDNVVALLFSDEKYKLQRKAYTFAEAFKAYEEGEEIESCVNGIKFKKKETTEGDIQDFYFGKHEKVWWRFVGFDLELMRGKWYINN